MFLRFAPDNIYDIEFMDSAVYHHSNFDYAMDTTPLVEGKKSVCSWISTDKEEVVKAVKQDVINYIQQKDIQKAFVQVGIGTEKRSHIISDKEKEITAYHEAGHAILYHVLPDVGPVYTVSVIPTGVGAAGYTMPLPEKDEMFLTKGKMKQDIMATLGGRIAEELIFDDVTTGASQDIKQATAYARAMVTKYGFSEKLGFINYETQEDDEVFLGRDLGHAKPYGEAISKTIDKEVKRIIDECYEDAKRIIVENMDVLHKCSEILLERERIDRKEFEALFEPQESLEPEPVV
jgi:cell division protease FtsH